MEQYLQFFVDYKQKDWLEWLATAKFAVHNNIYSATNVSLFMADYSREIRIGVDIIRKRKVEKVMKLVERMKKVQEEAVAALRKAQEKMKRQSDRGKNEVKNWKKRDKVMLSTKDLVFKKRLARKLVDQYVSSYIIDEVVSTNTIKL